MSAMDAAQEITITLPNVDAGAVYADRVRGREALSQTYEFEVDVLSPKVLDIDAMLGKAATLKVRVLDETATVHGVVQSAQSLDPTKNREFCYRFLIVPALAMMRHSTQNQVYGTDRDVSVIDILENELKDAIKRASATGGSRSDRRITYRMMAAGQYPKLDFVMQYRENDFDFISRLCEKFGVFYSFDQSGDREEVLFCDRNVHFQRVSGNSISGDIAYRTAAHTLGEGGFAIRSFNSVHTARAGQFQLREYNDETPSVDLRVSASAPFASHGVEVSYGENYRTTGEGKTLVKLHAERAAAQQLRFVGESNIPLLRPGYFFTLTDHPDAAFEQQYVVTEVEHRICEPSPRGFSSAEKSAEPYSNRFVCIPLKTQYRPALMTPKPVVHGVLIAFIDGPDNSTLAQIDEYGRYHVRILDEESGLSGGIASHLVRKTEPYGGGDGYGSHSVLLVGTEIVLSFINGDPDRPLIVGALSNAERNNTVVDSNAGVAHRTRTASGIIFEFNDGAL